MKKLVNYEARRLGNLGIIRQLNRISMNAIKVVCSQMKRDGRGVKVKSANSRPHIFGVS